MERWWSKKYRTPIKSYKEHTFEELLIEMLEDYYENNPKEIETFLSKIDGDTGDWEGETSDEYEADIQKRLKRVNEGVSFEKYQSEKVLSDKEEQALLDNLGKGLPKSTQKVDGEFEDEF